MSNLAALKTRLTDFARARLAMARSNPLFAQGAAVFAAVIVLDQLTKLWVLKGLNFVPGQSLGLSPYFDITYVQNRGVSFGILGSGDARWPLTVFSVVVTAAILTFLAGAKRPIAAIGLALIAGGAFGNAIDRALYGYVVDFLNFSGLWFPWVFNIADAGINVGVGAILLDTLLEGREKPAEGEDL